MAKPPADWHRKLRLDSRLTAYYKFVVPLIPAAGLGGVAVMFAAVGTRFSAGGWVFYGVASALVAAGFVAWHAPLKRVTATADGLVVDNFFAQATVPYSAIVAVEYRRYGYDARIRVTLAERCRFGKKIVFRAGGTRVARGDHPFAVLIRERAAASIPVSG